MLKRISMLLLPLAMPALVACSSEKHESEAPAPSDAITPALQQLADRAKPGTLGVMILDLQTDTARGVNLDNPMPMQSVFKLPLAIFVLAKAEKGEIELDETAKLTKADLSLAHSPIAEKFGEKQDYTIEELVRAAVQQSDNSAADVLLKRVGGPEALTQFMHQRGIEDFRLDRYEYELQPQAIGLPEFNGQWIGSKAFNEAQARIPLKSQSAALNLYLADPRDRISPHAAVQMLALLVRGKLLSPESTDKMMEILRGTATGATRLKAGIPSDAILYHKTGTGPDAGELNSATNDIGIVELIGGRKVAVAAFLSGAKLSPEERDAMIAQVAKLAVQLARPANVP